MPRARPPRRPLLALKVARWAEVVQEYVPRDPLWSSRHLGKARERGHDRLLACAAPERLTQSPKPRRSTDTVIP